MYFFPQYAVVIRKFSRWSHILAAVPSSSFPGGEKTEPPQSTVCAAMHFQGKAPQFLFRLGKPLLISAGAYSSCPSKAAAHRGLKTATLWWLCVFLQWQLRSKLSGTTILFLHSPWHCSSAPTSEAGVTNTRNLAVLPTLLLLYGLKIFIMAKREKNSCEQSLVIHNGLLLLPVLVQDICITVLHSWDVWGCDWGKIHCLQIVIPADKLAFGSSTASFHVWNNAEQAKVATTTSVI